VGTPPGLDNSQVKKMIEVALVFDRDGKTIAFHEPHGRTCGSIPDSRSLWEILWDNRHRLGGVAHSHPWDGGAYYSHTDKTTFLAIDKALGQNLLWPIVTFTTVGYFRRRQSSEGEGLGYVRCTTAPIEIEGIEELRERSRGR